MAKKYHLLMNSKSELNLKINGDFLHDFNEPLLEAQNFLIPHLPNIDKKEHILILGLGLGYHIQALLNYLKDKKRKKIIILEPDTEIVSLVKSNKLIALDEVEILCENSLENIYNMKSFVHFLSNSPAIIPHKKSMALNNDYFSSFFTFKASRKISDIMNLAQKNNFHFSFFSLSKETIPFDKNVEDVLKMSTEVSQYKNILDLYQSIGSQT